MMLNGVMGSGMSALYSGMGRMDVAAREIAAQPIRAVQPVGPQGGGEARQNDLVRPLVDNTQGLYQAQAGAVVLRNADQGIGTMLNMFA